MSRLASDLARAREDAARASARVALERADSGPSALADRAARVSLSGVSAELAAAREELDASARRHAARLAEVQSSFGAKLRDVRRVHAAQLASAVEAARAEHADTLKDARTTATAAKAKAKAALDAARRAVDDARNERTRADDAEARKDAEKDADVRAKDANVRAKDAETRLKDAETRLKDAETRSKDAETRLHASETRREEAEAATARWRCAIVGDGDGASRTRRRRRVAPVE